MGIIRQKNYRRNYLLNTCYKIFLTLFLEKIALMTLWKINFITYTSCETLEWLRYVWRTGGDVLNNVLIGIINKKKRLLEKPRTRWECNATFDLT